MDKVNLPINLELPKQYVEFWGELRRIYGLPADALNRVASEQMIEYLNLMHDGLAEQPVIGSGDVRKSLSLKLE